MWVQPTLLGSLYLRTIPTRQRSGYLEKLLFLQLNSADDPVYRVAWRARHRGHDIPEKTITRRFTKGNANYYKLYALIVDNWTLYDNSGDFPVMIY